jgi:ribosomal-protein-alanine N-acetyltransferase
MAMLSSNMTIETERVIIRPIVASDAVAYHKIESAAETGYFLGRARPQTKTIEAITYDIERREASWQVLACIDKTTSNFVGRCGYLGVAHPEEPEIHIVLSKDYWGKGLATEIGHALLLHGFQKRGLVAITGVVHPEHKASIRILEKLGMKCVGKRSENANDRQSGFLIYRIDRSAT